MTFKEKNKGNWREEEKETKDFSTIFFLKYYQILRFFPQHQQITNKCERNLVRYPVKMLAILAAKCSTKNYPVSLHVCLHVYLSV